MKMIKIILLVLLVVLLLFGLFSCQESFIFFPDKLPKDHKYNFNKDFQEITLKTYDNKKLNALLFLAEKSKGVIFYLHGNGGSLDSWGWFSKFYTDLNYDVFMLDYRGFGKSEGTITSEEQLFKDNQLAYDEIKKRYGEDKIIVLGYSIGTGLAAKLAADNNPNQLVLQAPYYNLIELAKDKYFAPEFLLRYKFKTNEFLKHCNCPITVFHGDKDNVISYDSSLKLKNEFKDKIKLIILKEAGHNGMSDNEEYRKQFKKIVFKRLEN